MTWSEHSLGGLNIRQGGTWRMEEVADLILDGRVQCISIISFNKKYQLGKISNVHCHVCPNTPYCFRGLERRRKVQNLNLSTPPTCYQLFAGRYITMHAVFCRYGKGSTKYHVWRACG